MKGDFLRPWLVAVVKLAHIVLQSDPSAPWRLMTSRRCVKSTAGGNVNHGVTAVDEAVPGSLRESANGDCEGPAVGAAPRVSPGYLTGWK